CDGPPSANGRGPGSLFPDVDIDVLDITRDRVHAAPAPCPHDRQDAVAIEDQLLGGANTEGMPRYQRYICTQFIDAKGKLFNHTRDREWCQVPRDGNRAKDRSQQGTTGDASCQQPTVD